MPLKFINSAGKQYLLYNNYKFRESRTMSDGNISWRCCTKNCNSGIKTNPTKTKILETKCIHKHKAPSISHSPCTSGTSTPSSKFTTSPTTSCSQPATSHKTTDSPILTQQPLSTSITAYDIPASNQQSPSTPAPVSTTDVEAENIALKEELATLRAEMKVILDHSVESDMRLLQYTDEVFTCSFTPSSPAYSDKVIQTESLSDETITSATISTDPSPSNSKLLAAFDEIERLKNEIALLKQPCVRCPIWKEEAEKMLETIRTLEYDRQHNKTSNIQETTELETTGTKVDSNESFIVVERKIKKHKKTRFKQKQYPRSKI